MSPVSQANGVVTMKMRARSSCRRKGREKTIKEGKNEVREKYSGQEPRVKTIREIKREKFGGGFMGSS